MCIGIDTHVSVYICIHTHIHTLIHIYSHMHIHTYTYIHSRIHIHSHIHIYTLICINTLIYIYTLSHTAMHTFICMYTYSRLLSCAIFSKFQCEIHHLLPYSKPEAWRRLGGLAKNQCSREFLF